MIQLPLLYALQQLDLLGIFRGCPAGLLVPFSQVADRFLNRRELPLLWLVELAIFTADRLLNGDGLFPRATGR